MVLGGRARPDGEIPVTNLITSLRVARLNSMLGFLGLVLLFMILCPLVFGRFGAETGRGCGKPERATGAIRLRSREQAEHAQMPDSPGWAKSCPRKSGAQVIPN
jgi:hypothetical protein